MPPACLYHGVLDEVRAAAQEIVGLLLSPLRAQAEDVVDCLAGFGEAVAELVSLEGLRKRVVASSSG